MITEKAMLEQLSVVSCQLPALSFRPKLFKNCPNLSANWGFCGIALHVTCLFSSAKNWRKG
jgi:hypothetical protein